MLKISHWFILALALMIPSFSHAAELSNPEVQAEIASWITDTNKRVSEKQSRQIVSSAVSFSKKNDLDPLWVLSIIRAESNFQSNVGNSYGAKGLMQVVPRYHKDKLLGRNPYNIDVNIEVGTKIMADCMGARKGHKQRALSCYSGGAGGVYQRKIASTHTELRKLVKTALAALGVDVNKQVAKVEKTVDDIEGVWLSAQTVKIEDLTELNRALSNPYALAFLK